MVLSDLTLLLYYIFSILNTISVFSIFTTLFIDFTIYGSKATIKKSKRSFVATGSMLSFYGIYFAFMQLHLGAFSFANRSQIEFYLNAASIVLATFLVVTGATINILGRLRLSDNWANQIKIYKEHTLVTEGVYKLIRHPLYTALILFFAGGSLAYKNILCAALTLFIFVPFISYRAKQEEKLLLDEFLEYEKYMQKTGMLLPKISNIKQIIKNS